MRLRGNTQIQAHALKDCSVPRGADHLLEFTDDPEIDFQSRSLCGTPTPDGALGGGWGLSRGQWGECCSHGAYVLDEIWTSAFLGFGGFRRCEKMLLLLPNGSQIILTTGPVLSLRVKVTRTSWICPSPISSSRAEGAGRLRDSEGGVLPLGAHLGAGWGRGAWAGWGVGGRWYGKC